MDGSEVSSGYDMALKDVRLSTRSLSTFLEDEINWNQLSGNTVHRFVIKLPESNTELATFLSNQVASALPFIFPSTDKVFT